MAEISKVERDSVGDELYQRPPKDRIRRVAIALFWIALAMLTAIGFYGSNSSHRGQLIVSNSGESQPVHYVAQLEPSSKLFDSNDLFVITDISLASPTLTSIDPDSLRLDPATDDGRVTFQAFTSERVTSAIPVSFRLSPCWKNVIPAALVIVILTSLLMALPALKRLRSDHFLKSRAALNTLSVGSVLLAVALLIGFNVGISGWEYGDNHQFLVSTVQGKWLQPSIYPSLGRFFPLGVMDNNLLIPFGNNPLAYHIERSILLCIVVSTIFLLARRMAGVPVACLATLVFLTAPDLFRVYSESIFPESQLIVWLMLFLLFYHRVATHTGKSWSQVLNVAAVCIFAAAATYCKEPAFGLLLIFSAVHVVFGFAKQTVATIFVHGFLVVNAVVFVSLYWLWCHEGQNYAAIQTDGTGITIFSTMLKNFGSPMAIVVVFTACWRFWRLTQSKDRDHLFADAALFAGVGYVFAFCLLKLSANYYMTPAHACWAVASASYLAAALPDLLKNQSRSVLRDRSRRLARLSVAVVLMVVLLQGIFTRKCIKRQVSRRIQSVQLVKFFNHLDRNGVRLVAYMPQDMKGYARRVQAWRQQTINIFADCETAQLRRIDSESPVVSADLPAIEQMPRRKLVICPPKYAHRFGSGETSGQPWQRVEQYPHVMGAFMYVQNLQVADYRAAANGSDRPVDQAIIK